MHERGGPPPANQGPDFRDFDPTMTNCYTATMNCPNTDPLPFVYAYAPNSQNTTLLGTIVMFSGGGGEMAGNAGFQGYYVPYYESQGYQVVEIAWGAYGTQGTAWELANSTAGSNSGPNILNAACRPATFLHYVKTSGIWTAGGMCAHGDSGGSGALAYALTWYGEGADIDKVLLENGPVFSDINRGCQVTCQGGQCTNGQYTQICTGSPSQYGCNNWLTHPVENYSLEYVGGDGSSVNQWSGNAGIVNSAACANNNSTTGFNSQWASMSIVVGSSPNASATFSYPNTAMSAWLCSSVSNPGATLNNSMSQAEIFYQQFTQASQAGGTLSVNGVSSCPTTENVEFGTVIVNGTTFGGDAYVALEQDMAGPTLQLANSWPTACYAFRR